MSLSDYNAEQSAKKLDLLLKQQERISALEAELSEAKKVSSERYDVINKQAVTILSMRNCGNCKHSGIIGANQICFGCHGFEDVDPKAKKSYLAKWKPVKQVVK